MLNLNSASILDEVFGQGAILPVLLIVQIVLVVLEAAVFAILIARTKNRKQEGTPAASAPPVYAEPLEFKNDSKPIPEGMPDDDEIGNGYVIDGSLRYDKSFTARLIRSDNKVKNRYALLKNELLSYKKVKSRLSWKREIFRFGKKATVKLSYRGKTLCIYLPIDPAALEYSKYKIESVKDSATYADTPCLYRIKNDRRVKYAIELITYIMRKAGAEKNGEYVFKDFYVPYESIAQLMERGLIRRNIKAVKRKVIIEKSRTEANNEAAFM